MTISVLMSTYIREKSEYLDAALESIWTNQLRKPDEIILIEDGPLTQELYNTINKWKKIIGPSITIISNKHNLGLAASLNKGICKARGTLIARMDSDDISVPERFLQQEKYMIEHPETDILGGAIKEFSDDGTLDNLRTYPLTMHQVIESIHKASPLAHPSVMFRKTIFDNGLQYSSKYHLCEDITLWFEAAHKNHIINNLPDTILLFRRNDAVIKRRSKEKAWSEFRAYNYGINILFGPFSIKYAYSVMRLLFRLMPTSIIRYIYNSKLRTIITK